MGCDGGTIPKRDELIKTKKKGEQKDKHSERVYRWRHCAVSQTPLRRPVVACELGRLYNKDEVITRLLNKTQEGTNMSHIRGLKDVRELQLSDNPAYEGEKQQLGGESLQITRSQWICPVSGLEMHGKHGFCYLWTCGCVLATRVLKEVSSSTCSRCGTPFSPADIVTLNPGPERLEEARTAMQERRRKAKEDKKKDKRKADDQQPSSSASADEDKASKKLAKKAKLANGPSSSSSGAAGPSKPGVSISGLASSILRGTDFTNVRSKDFSVANNPQHSEVYKSIFDTHKSANKKLKSNWVTCNPQYY